MSATGITRDLARRLNPVIDRMLLDLSEGDVALLRRMTAGAPAIELAERVRQRAVRLGRRTVGIAARRDSLIAALYAAEVPRGWFVAWCDGSSSRTPPGRAGLGGIIVNPQGEVIARSPRFVPDLDPFAAEIAALAAVLQAGIDAGAKQVRVHTDCAALAQLWHALREDPRLDSVRALARQYRRFELRAIPRTHNEPAHRLARAAMTNPAHRQRTAGMRD